MRQPVLKPVPEPGSNVVRLRKRTKFPIGEEHTQVQFTSEQKNKLQYIVRWRLYGYYVLNASCKNVVIIKKISSKLTKCCVHQIMNNASWPNLFWIIGYGVLWISAVMFGSGDAVKFILAYNKLDGISYTTNGIRFFNIYIYTVLS